MNLHLKFLIHRFTFVVTSDVIKVEPKDFHRNVSFFNIFHLFFIYFLQINCEDWIQFHVMNDNSNVVMVNAYQFRLLVTVKMTVWMDLMKIPRSV